VSVAPHAGIVDFGTFTPPAGGLDGIQGEAPAPLAGQEAYVLTAAGWAPGGSGTVTSVALSGGSTGLGFSGTPITTSGTITLGGTLALAYGGTGASTASAARTNLGLATVAATGAYSDLTGGPSLGTSSALNVDTDGTFTANSDTRVPSQKATKTYVDQSVTSALKYKGSIDASTNPNYPAAAVGDAYVISVAGKIGGASGVSVDAGDMIVCNTTNAGGTQAAVGASWTILEHNLVGALLAGNNLSDLLNVPTARTNLGLATVAATGAYSDLSGKPTLPSGPIVGTTDAQTLSSKRIDPRVDSQASTATISPDLGSYDMHARTAQAAALTVNAPIGTPLDGDKLTFRFKDNGTARALTWNGVFRAIGVTIPTTTVISKTVYVGAIYNAADTKWDVIAVAQEA